VLVWLWGCVVGWGELEKEDNRRADGGGEKENRKRWDVRENCGAQILFWLSLFFFFFVKK
jgi:hypothetical protein